MKERNPMLIREKLIKHIGENKNIIKVKTRDGQYIDTSHMNDVELYQSMINIYGSENCILNSLYLYGYSENIKKAQLDKIDLIINGMAALGFFGYFGMCGWASDDNLLWREMPQDETEKGALMSLLPHRDRIDQLRIHDLCFIHVDNNIYTTNFVRWEDIKNYNPKKYEYFWDSIFKERIQYTIKLNSAHYGADMSVYREFCFFLRETAHKYGKEKLIRPFVFNSNRIEFDGKEYTFLTLMCNNKLMLEKNAPGN